MNIYFKITLIILSIFLFLCGLQMQIYYRKHPISSAYKNWTKYSNYTSLLYIILGLLWTISLLLNFFNMFIYIPFVFVFVGIIDAKYGKLKKSSS